MRPNRTQYSLMAVALLGSFHESLAQVQYTDVDPDFVIDDEDDLLFLDIDGNDTDDFIFGIGALTYYIGTGSIEYKINGVAIAWSFQPQNAIIGETISHDYAIFAFASNYSDDKLIGEHNLWIEGLPNFAFICGNKYGGVYGGWLPFGQIGFWQDIQTDRFIGIRFQDGLDRTHYGWIRCDAPDSGRVLVIKDYAYETQAGVGIIAGDMGEAVGIQTEHELLFSLYPNPAEDWIEIRYYENEQLYADIRNLEGKLLLTQALQSGSANRLPVAELPVGTYVAVIRNETGEVKGKQVWVKSR